MYIPFFLWISKFFKNSRPQAAVKAPGKRLQVEPLEDRITPFGTFTALSNLAPGSAVGTMELLTNGDVLMQYVPTNGSEPDTGFAILTPNAQGSYVNGSFSIAAPSPIGRLYTGDAILKNGDFLFVGGEYVTNSSAGFSGSGDIYNPFTNKWSTIPAYPGGAFGDEETFVLPNGNVLTGDLEDNAHGVSQTYIFNPTTEKWSPTTGAKLYGDQSDEENWTELPNGNILSYDIFKPKPGDTESAQQYNPSTGKWEYAGEVPVTCQSYYFSYSAPGYENGPAVTLPNGQVLQIGTEPVTALYTEGANPTDPGSWVAGPAIPDNLGSNDGPAAVETNGLVLFAVSNDTTYTAPTQLDEYSYTNNSITTIPSGDIPTALESELENNPAYTDRMLDLPNGQILFTDGDNNQLWVYTPSGAPQSTWKPTITNVPSSMAQGDTYTLTGTQITGLDQGAYYGDDAQMDTNRPIVYLENSSNDIFYATTSNWSTTLVQTGSTPETTDVEIPSSLPNGNYSLYVSANGIVSAPVSVTIGPSINENTANLSATAGSLVIHGHDFNDTKTNDTIIFNDGAVGTVTHATTTALTVSFATKPETAGELTAEVEIDGFTSAAVQVATVIPVVTATKASLGVDATTLVINGFGFDPTAGNDTVTFSGAGANDGTATGVISSATPTQLTVTISGQSLGRLNAVVHVDGESNGAAVQVATVDTNPVVVTPSANTIAANGTLTITGTGFFAVSADDKVAFSNGSGKVTGATTTSLTVINLSGLVAGDLLASVTADGVLSPAVQVATVTPVVNTNTSNNISDTAAKLVIHGFGFSTKVADDTITFQNGVTGTISTATNTALTVTHLSGLSSGSVLAQVTVNGQLSNGPVEVANVTTPTLAPIGALPNSTTKSNVNGASLTSFGGASAGNFAALTNFGGATPFVSPNIGDLASGAATLVIHGTGFSPVAADNTVTFADGVTGKIIGATGTTLTIADLSGLTAGSLRATVTSDGVSSETDVTVATVT